VKTPDPPREAVLAAGGAVIGLGAAAVGVLGPLLSGTIEYHVSDGARNQIMGGDIAGLVLVAPVSLVATVLMLRRHRAGPVLALGPAVYAVYMYSQLALGGDFVRYPGNSERFFPLFLGLFLVVALVSIRAWTVVDGERLPAISSRITRLLGAFLLVMAAFLTFGLHLPTMAEVWNGGSPPPEYLADPAVFWLVKLMDLGIVVPAMLAIGVGLLRRSDWAETAGYAAIGWMALLGSSVAGMAMVMQLRGDPAASFLNTIAFGSFAVLLLIATWLVYSPLFQRDDIRHIPPRVNDLELSQ
jgi:hypothetical protein